VAAAVKALRERGGPAIAGVAAAGLGVVLIVVWLGVAVIAPSLDALPCNGVEFHAPASAAAANGRAVPPIGGAGGIAGRVRSLFHSGAPVVHCHDFADPFVLRVGHAYYAYSTNDADHHVPVLTSSGLFGTARVRDALPNLPSWSTTGFVWAPAVLPRPGGYVLFYATRLAGTDRQCLSTALAADPAGPFVDGSTGPLVCPAGGGAIDPAPVTTTDGRTYLLWKNYDGVTGIVGQELSADGRALVGPVRVLLRADQPWQGGVVEAPDMVENAGRFFLFYSGNDWNGPNYAVGYAVCSTPLGPCADHDGPWLGSSDSARGPGGVSVFTDTRGQTWMAVHSWVRDKVGYPQGARDLFVLRLDFQNGAPVVS
jgi:beta-xylosidase